MVGVVGTLQLQRVLLPGDVWWSGCGGASKTFPRPFPFRFGGFSRIFYSRLPTAVLCRGEGVEGGFLVLAPRGRCFSYK